MARIKPQQYTFDPTARAGERIMMKGGPEFAQRGLFGGNMDIDELNKLNRAIASGMDIAKDIVPTIKGVVDAPMKKIQELMQQSDIKDARAKAAAELALKDKALPLNKSIVGTGTPPAGQEVFREDITEVETQVPSGPSRQEADRETLSLIDESREESLLPLYGKYRVTPGDKQGLASALRRAKVYAGGRLQHAFPGATASPIAQRDVLEDEKVFISTLSSTGEEGGPLGAYRDIKRDADAARSASVKSRAIDAAQSRGTEQYRSGNYEDAAKSMLSAYSMDPNYSYLLNAAKARFKAGDLDGAKELYIKAAMTPGAPPEIGKVVATMIQNVDAAMAKGASQPARPSAPMPSATGASVTPLQASTSGAPMRSVPAPAGQRAMRPPAQAAPAVPAAPASQVGAVQVDRQLLADPANRAFVRTVLKEMQQSGMEPDLGYATDLLTLELAKRGTGPQMISEPTVRERLDMPPQQAAAGMDMMGLFALADQSTVADWPKIEPIAEIVIKQRPLGFLDLMDMEGNKKKIYDRLAKKKPGTPGVEFDLSGIAKRRLEGAKASKTRRRPAGKKSRRSSLDRYLINKDEKRSVGGKVIPVTVAYTNKRFDALKKKVDSGKAKDSEVKLYNDILKERQMRNKSYGITDVKGLDPKDKSINQDLQAQADYATAKSLVDSTEKAIEEHNENEPQKPKDYNPNRRSGQRYDNLNKTWKAEKKKLDKELRDAKAKLKGAASKLPVDKRQS